MKRTLAVIAAMALLSAPASADFSVSKPKPVKPAPAPKPSKKPRPTPPVKPTVASKPKPVPLPLPQSDGIEPAMVHEALVAAGYQAKLVVNPKDGSQWIDATNGTSGWTVFMKECASANRCRLIEYNLTWRIPNDANVCRSWTYYITKDEGGKKGLPTCYTVPPSGKEFRLWLSSDQGPYVGIDKAPRAEAKDRLVSMAKAWNDYVIRLPEARDIATKKCPKKKDKCW